MGPVQGLHPPCTDHPPPPDPNPNHHPPLDPIPNPNAMGPVQGWHHPSTDHPPPPDPNPNHPPPDPNPNCHLIPFVSTFSHTITGFHRTVKNNFSLLQSQPYFSKHRVISAYRKNPSLHDILIHSKFSSNRALPHTQHSHRYITENTYITNTVEQPSCPWSTPNPLGHPLPTTLARSTCHLRPGNQRLVDYWAEEEGRNILDPETWNNYTKGTQRHLDASPLDPPSPLPTSPGDDLTHSSSLAHGP
ncbi:hypothetical protein F7725_023386 [Dissostichus mawsoni]|uniref:Uncharacterized protein n=1 Tax=Dissostichus mawsoni TaxID=36200 RepID=A0A7J5Z2J0_DISMA|nr:hypothetical protein F7725_023386 [Dissostichus mawsoni]